MHTRRDRPCPPERRAIRRASPLTIRAGFTLIELLVVLGVVSILLTLSITVGFRVLEGGKERLARDTLRLLDNSLTTWTTEKESKFPAYLDGEPISPFPGGPPRPTKAPIIDGGPESSTAVSPTLAMYLVIARRSPSVETMFKQQIDTKYLATAQQFTAFGEYINNADWDGRTINDPWGQPYRFVHPVWHGGYGAFVLPDGGSAGSNRPTREVPSVDGLSTRNYARSYKFGGGRGQADEGLCPGNRPYFYSAGPDGDPGTRGDNIYLETARPTYPPETSNYNVE